MKRILCVFAAAFVCAMVWSTPCLADGFQLQEMGLSYVESGGLTTSVTQQGTGLNFETAELASAEAYVSYYDPIDYFDGSTESSWLDSTLAFRLLGPDGATATVNGDVLMDLTYTAEADGGFVTATNAVAKSSTQFFTAYTCVDFQCNEVASWSDTIGKGAMVSLGFPDVEEGELNASDSFSFGTVAVNNLPEGWPDAYYGEYMEVTSWYETDAIADEEPYGHAFALAMGDEQVNLTVAPTSTPEAGTLSLVGLGLIGFAALLRKKLRPTA
jgi:hypothetical protein